MPPTYTNAGAILLATALQSPGAQVAPTYAALGAGCGALASGLTSGNVYTALPLAAGLPAPLAHGQSLTLIDAGGDTQLVTTSAAVLAGATSIPVNSFTASATFAAGSGVTTTPSVSDTALFNETYRIALAGGTAGGSAGESLISAYFDPRAPSGTYVEVGLFAGSTAMSALGSGVLFLRDVQLWIHTQNADSATYTADTTLSLT